jgi:steroid delta-isomerase-like uncharacterized protein
MSTATSIHRDIAECWNRRDFDAIRDLLHSEYTYTGGDGKETAGADAGVRVARMWAEAFPDGRLEVKHVYTQGNTAVAEMVGRGTHTGEFMGIAPTGRRVEVLICNVIELREGKVHHEREYVDMLAVLTQLGVAQAPRRTASA